MPLQLGGSGFRPAQVASPYQSIRDQEAKAQEVKAQKMVMQLQQMQLQSKMNEQQDAQAANHLHQYIGSLSQVERPASILGQSIKAGSFAYDADANPFSGQQKQYAWENYSKQAANPNYQAFEGAWKNAKSQYNTQILNDIVTDAQIGRIGSQDINIALRGPEFAKWLTSSGVSPEILEQFKSSVGYDPSYRTWGEALNPFSETSMVQEHPYATAIGGVGAGYGMYKAGKYFSSQADLQKKLDKATALYEKYSKTDVLTPKGRFSKAKAGMTKKAWVARGKRYQKGVESAQKALDDLKLVKNPAWKKIADSKAWKRGGKTVGGVVGMMAAEPLVSSVTGSDKAGRIAGSGIAAGIGAKITKDRIATHVTKTLQKKGAMQAGQKLGDIIKKKGWNWVVKTALKKSPGLVAKIGLKAGAGTIGGPFTGGAMTAAMAAWTAYDLYDLYNAIVDEA